MKYIESSIKADTLIISAFALCSVCRETAVLNFITLFRIEILIEN